MKNFSHFRQRNRHRHRFHLGAEVKSYSYPKIILVGNPNVGKSALFNALTGKYVVVSNYPGTSVEITSGEITIGEDTYELIDSPGINSLNPHSEDEQVTLNLLLESSVKCIVQVIDSKNLKRGLLLTYQLAALGFPLVVCLNIFDEALERGVIIKVETLKNIFGVEFVPTVATENQGIELLKEALRNPQIPYCQLHFHQEIENTLQRISSQLNHFPHLKSRGLALNIISAEGRIPPPLLSLNPELDHPIKNELKALSKKIAHPLGYEIHSTIANHIENQSNRFLKIQQVERRNFSEKLGSLTMHRWYGIPFIILVLFLLYELVGVFGAGTCVDFIENKIFGGQDSQGDFYGILNPAFIRFLIPLKQTAVGTFFYDLLVDKYGVITVGLTYSIAIVFPLVSLFFVYFGILEDSGYLPRLTVLSHKIFRFIGLNGRAVLPMVMGLGCDTMATFTTRILESKKERTIATLLLALGIPCSAQLGVVLGMMSAISMGMLLIVLITVLMQLLIVGYFASKFLKGEPSPLLTEIPPLRLPKMKNIYFKTYFRVKWFMQEAVPLFVLGTLVLFLLEKLALLSAIECFASPVITGLLQLPPASVQAFIVGFLRRDYGAAGLFHLAQTGLMNNIQITVGITVMILFVPCLANFFVIIKERGLRTAILISSFIVVYAILIGGMLNLILRLII